MLHSVDIRAQMWQLVKSCRKMVEKQVQEIGRRVLVYAWHVE